MCDYSRKPVKWQVGNFSYLLISPAVVALSTVGGYPPRPNLIACRTVNRVIRPKRCG